MVPHSHVEEVKVIYKNKKDNFHLYSGSGIAPCWFYAVFYVRYFGLLCYIKAVISDAAAQSSDTAFQLQILYRFY